jgi:AcrR family transcriptional regulator
MPPKLQTKNNAPAASFSAVQLRLVDAATKLFAEHGIDGVALKDIVAAAGQKNQSAIQYHFRDKDGLIAAALDARFRAIDARRAAMAEAALALEGATRRKAILRAVVEPILAEAETHALGPAYIRFVVQALQRPDFDAAAIMANKDYPGFAALNAAVSRERGRPFPPAEAAQRARISAKLTMAGVADWVAQGFGPMPREKLIDMLCAANEALILS